ncbi:hypothetical protein SAMN05444851_2996 [Aliiroseovarius sediminilitoris]|uniref:Uncharacterized protein n=1 Tax=Aliiroseovarius sediminilitoris TaxID=1173584 RepID=A0A1I0QW32_9RHOB|nr:hypothetical protein [Aliiroseovarius sediminilitoris]SEW31655.1 hypothetical protein SAMN05444851_2996 [Aliiroseovarius sediminilitoris]
MTKPQLVKARIQAGVWEGVLTIGNAQDDPPDLQVTHLSQKINGVTVAAHPDQNGAFVVKVPIPAELLTDGVQTFLITDKNSGATLNSFSIMTGQPLETDIRAEVDLLRAELDMLKRAFRRHCMETS